MTENHAVEVRRAAPGDARATGAALPALGEGQVRLRVDRFALTANNVTYAVMGDALGYWGFFPTGDPGWGNVPAMGWADVVESTHPEVPPGGRCFGWYPMARYLDLTVRPVAEGLRDEGAHRAPHAAVYRTYTATDRDPWYPAAAGADGIGDAEDRHALLRGLFLTALLADARFADEGYFGAEAVVVLSASSKTAIGFAQRAAGRDVEVVGVTSARNADFVRSLGWYDRVVGYDEIATLPVVPTVSIDMSGDGTALGALHGHLGDHLAYSMLVGASHHDAPRAAPVAAGPEPQFFFAPTEVPRRIEEWGREEYQRRSTEALEAFVAGSLEWLTVERVTGVTAAEAAWHDAVAGRVPPSVGRIVSVHG